MMANIDLLTYLSSSPLTTRGNPIQNNQNFVVGSEYFCSFSFKKQVESKVSRVLSCGALQKMCFLRASGKIVQGVFKRFQ